MVSYGACTKCTEFKSIQYMTTKHEVSSIIDTKSLKSCWEELDVVLAVFQNSETDALYNLRTIHFRALKKTMAQTNYVFELIITSKCFQSLRRCKLVER